MRPDSSRVLLVEIRDDETYDTVRDAVADLGLGLVRLEQRRHRVAEIFTDEAPNADEAPPSDELPPTDQAPAIVDAPTGGTADVTAS